MTSLVGEAAPYLWPAAVPQSLYARNGSLLACAIPFQLVNRREPSRCSHHSIMRYRHLAFCALVNGSPRTCILFPIDFLGPISEERAASSRVESVAPGGHHQSPNREKTPSPGLAVLAALSLGPLASWPARRGPAITSRESLRGREAMSIPPLRNNGSSGCVVVLHAHF